METCVFGLKNPHDTYGLTQKMSLNRRLNVKNQLRPLDWISLNLLFAGMVTDPASSGFIVSGQGLSTFEFDVGVLCV